MIGVDLTGADLTGADMNTVDLRGANLTDANLTRVDLQDANLIETEMTGANFTDTDISNSTITQISRDSLIGRIPEDQLNSLYVLGESDQDSEVDSEVDSEEDSEVGSEEDSDPRLPGLPAAARREDDLPDADEEEETLEERRARWDREAEILEAQWDQPQEEEGAGESGDVESFYNPRKGTRLESFDAKNFNAGNINTCRDIEMGSDTTSREETLAYIDDNDHVIFITTVYERGTEVIKATCLTRTYLKGLLEDPRNSILFECTGNFMPRTQEDIDIGETEPIDKSMGDFDRKHPYVKITIDEDGMTALVPVSELVSVVNSRESVYFIVPHYGRDGVQQSLSHTIAWVATGYPGYTPAYDALISVNHCQRGSNKLVYSIKACRSKNCYLIPKRNQRGVDLRDKSPGPSAKPRDRSRSVVRSP
jgi:hypothetical protein